MTAIAEGSRFSGEDPLMQFTPGLDTDAGRRNGLPPLPRAIPAIEHPDDITAVFHEYMARSSVQLETPSSTPVPSSRGTYPSPAMGDRTPRLRYAGPARYSPVDTGKEYDQSSLVASRYEPEPRDTPVETMARDEVIRRLVGIKRRYQDAVDWQEREKNKSIAELDAQIADLRAELDPREATYQSLLKAIETHREQLLEGIPEDLAAEKAEHVRVAEAKKSEIRRAGRPAHQNGTGSVQAIYDRAAYVPMSLEYIDTELREQLRAIDRRLPELLQNAREAAAAVERRLNLTHLPKIEELQRLITGYELEKQKIITKAESDKADDHTLASEDQRYLTERLRQIDAPRGFKKVSVFMRRTSSRSSRNTASSVTATGVRPQSSQGPQGFSADSGSHASGLGRSKLRNDRLNPVPPEKPAGTDPNRGRRKITRRAIGVVAATVVVGGIADQVFASNGSSPVSESMTNTEAAKFAPASVLAWQNAINQALQNSKIAVPYGGANNWYFNAVDGDGNVGDNQRLAHGYTNVLNVELMFGSGGNDKDKGENSPLKSTETTHYTYGLFPIASQEGAAQAQALGVSFDQNGINDPQTEVLIAEREVNSIIIKLLTDQSKADRYKNNVTGELLYADIYTALGYPSNDIKDMVQLSLDWENGIKHSAIADKLMQDPKYKQAYAAAAKLVSSEQNSKQPTK